MPRYDSSNVFRKSKFSNLEMSCLIMNSFELESVYRVNTLMHFVRSTNASRGCDVVTKKIIITTTKLFLCRRRETADFHTGIFV